MAAPTKYVDREIPQISLKDFDNRIDEITAQLAEAAERVGFFGICDHGIETANIVEMFKNAESFFQLPDDVKTTVPWNPQNVGYEKCTQVRPANGGEPDIKESYQLQFGENMQGLWMDDGHVPGFKDKSLRFMDRVQGVSEKLMLCLARSLGFADDHFIKLHDSKMPNSQSTLRLIHYFATPRVNDGRVYHRAGAHADWGFLTLLFQKEGQSGLEICPGREVVTESGLPDADAQWTKVELGPGDIICNIGDLLMSWSDDRFKSTFHRVKAPSEPDDYYGERYSIAFFNQPRKDSLIQGPKKKYPMVTGEEFTAGAMKRYYSAAKAKVEAKDERLNSAKRPIESSLPVESAA